MPQLDTTRLPACTMDRVILHWTAGTHTASALDREHYHVLVEGGGAVVFGRFPIDANAAPPREPRASHTRRCNTGSIGVAVCCMQGARERPFAAGPFPMTLAQWQVAAEVVAELCARYGISVTPRTVLAHGEVQATLQIPQLGKWDPLVQPWSPSTPRQQVMDEFRALVNGHLNRLAAPAVAARATAAAPPPPAGSPAAPAAFPQSLDWTDDSAVLLVHGVGNARPGDYTDVEAIVRASAGGSPAVYSLFYDVYNNWMVEKTQVQSQLTKLVEALKLQSGAVPKIADFAGDVLWPLFSLSARTTVLTAFRAQLRQMRLDGMRSRGKLPGHLRFSIVCHSLGCFYTYEVLHQLATNDTFRLRPATEGMRFRGAVFVASPIGLIRHLAGAVGALIPGPLATLAPGDLHVPAEPAFGAAVSSVERLVSLTGTLDPIGGYFVRNPLAPMNVAGQIPVVDEQTLGAGDETNLLATLLGSAAPGTSPPTIGIANPHSWRGYLERHQGELAGWLA